MTKMIPSILFLSCSVLSGCSIHQPEVEKINNMQIPLVLPGTKTPPTNIAQMASLYQHNKQQINDLTNTLKAQYLQNVKAKDIFEQDSEVQPVFASLSKLEELEMVNQRYLKEHNVSGLQKISLALQPVIAG